MNWLEQWRALAARIDGLIRAGEFLVAAFQVHTNDEHQAVRKSLSPELNAVTEAISELGQKRETEIPPKAIAALKRYEAQNWHRSIAGADASKGTIAVQVLAPLAAFRSEFEYLIRDSEIEACCLTELAFEHLRRQLVVDTEIQKKWLQAFEKNELACERLGAVHLLSHGIWAFKIVAPGGATDLVYGDPIQERVVGATRIARALVLTEWKLVKDEGEVDLKSQTARIQMALYTSGILGDLELKRTRYVVLVTKPEFNPPPDICEQGITYRHVVVPIEPRPPSVTAQRGVQNRTKKSQRT